MTAQAFEEAVMSGKTGDDRGPRHESAGIGQAAACIQFAVTARRGGRGGRGGGSR
jgi:hypothetical protein